MKTIQWYPGHMAKAMRMMEETLSLSDAVVFVLDARCPASSFNPRLLTLAGTKPVLFVLNKADLAAPAPDTAALLKKSGRSAVRLSANSPAAVRPLRDAMTEVAAERIARNEARGIKKPVRFMVAGIPNTGKSTLINLLAGAKKAQTGDKAGVTRAKQWVRCGNFDLLDTPGTMPPACENQVFARRLAYVGSIHDEILAIDEIALALLEELQNSNPMSLFERYGTKEGTPLELLEAVCTRRGFVLRGGEYDYERGERAVLDDLRKGRLGRVLFDSEEDLRAAGLIV